MGTISKNEIKKIRSLAQKKFRDELGLFTVEGEKLVAEALASSFQVENVYRRDEIGEEAMSRITMLASPSPVLAVVRKPEDCHIAGGSLREAIVPTGLYLGLDVIRDPGNLGTIVRVADWFGADFGKLDIAANYNLVFNAAILVEAGVGYAVTLDGLADTSPESALCFRPLRPRLESGLDLIWKKYQVFSPAAELFLARLREMIGQ